MEIENQVNSFINLFCERIGITTTEFFSQNRSHHLSIPRIVLGGFIYKKFGLTKSDIGRIFNRDHTTILYYVNQYEALLRYKHTLAVRYNKICKKIFKGSFND